MVYFEIGVVAQHLALLLFFIIGLEVPVSYSLTVPTTTQEKRQLSSFPTNQFKTDSYRAPILETVFDGDVLPGYLFYAPFGFPPTQNVPIISTKTGELIWHGPIQYAPEAVLGFEQQVLNSTSVLTYWTGSLVEPQFQRGYGTISLLDNRYNQIYSVSLNDTSFVTLDNKTYPSYLDIHENFVTDRGSVVVTATNITQADLTSVGGPPHGWVIDSLLYEIDVKTNRVLFKWSALEHIDQIPFAASREPLNGTGTSQANPWNYFVLNSAQLYGDSYIISGRYYCTIYLINPQGHIEWQLNGQNGHSFALSDGTSFCYQHHVRIESSSGPISNPETMLIHMHNNENSDVPTSHPRPTNGLLLLIDFSSRTATMLRSLQNASAPIYSTFMGSYQALEMGHVILGHGAIPLIEEYNASGYPVMSARFGQAGSVISYRAFASNDWVGIPDTQPALYACNSMGNTTTVYMSWNGATEYTTWIVYDRSPDIQAPKALVVVDRQGFETRAEIPRVTVVEVEARTGQESGVFSGVVKVQNSC